MSFNIDVDDCYMTTPSPSLEKGANNDPFRSYLSDGVVQFMVANDITTAENRCTSEERRRSRKNKNVIFKCEHCPYETRYRQDLRRHSKRHVDSPYPCKDCNMPFNIVGFLNRHRKEIHGVDTNCTSKKSRLWKCDMCKYVTVHNKDFRRHKDRHLATGAVHCRYCNHPYMCSNRLSLHVRREHMNTNGDGHGKTRSKRPTNDESLVAGVKKAKEMLLRRKSEINNIAHSVDKNSNSLERLKRKINKTTLSVDKKSDSVEKFMQTDSTTEEASVDKEDAEIAVDESLRERVINYLNCVFCGYVATSYVELKEHLDVHDNEYEVIDAENGDSLFLSPENSPGDNDNHFYDNFADGAEHSEKSVADKDMNNEIVHLETNIESKEMYIATKYTFSPEQTNMTTLSAQQKQPIFENMSEEEQDSKDAMIIYGECISKLFKNPDDEFIMKPFACSKCFFTTGNIEHLKVHVEAHLYEKARAAYKVAHRGAVAEYIGSSGYNVNEQTGADNEITKCVDGIDAEDTDMEIDNIRNDEIDNTDQENEKNNSENVDVDSVNDTDEGFCDKDLECKQEKLTNSIGNKQNSWNYIGRLSKEEFKKTKRLYKKSASGGTNGAYECSICEFDYHFQNRTALKEHFRQNHLELREKLCASCKHCSKPFP